MKNVYKLVVGKGGVTIFVSFVMLKFLLIVFLNGTIILTSYRKTKEYFYKTIGAMSIKPIVINPFHP